MEYQADSIVVRKVMPELRNFAGNISIIDGPHVRVFGVPLPTRMIIVKLSDGSLWINSPVSVPEQLLDHIKALGPVKYLVAPTKLHTWRLEEWRGLFQNVEFWIPPDGRRASKRALRDRVLGDTSPPGWASDLDQLVLRGNLFVQEVFFFHKRSRTLIVGDFIQNHPVEIGKPLLNGLWRIAGVAQPHGGVPIDIRLSFNCRNTTRRCLEKMFSWDFDKLIIAHGVCVERDAKRFVDRAFRWLVR